MVTAAQLNIVQSPITSLITNVSTSVTVKLDDTNYLVWQYQIRLLLESHGIIDFVDGTRQCPTRFVEDATTEGVETDAFQIWKMHDRALMQLIIATLSPTAMSCVIGCFSSHDMWMSMKDRFSIVTKASIFQLKTELQNIKKGYDSVSTYLQRIKDVRDHLSAAGVSFEDDDIMILALKGLHPEYNTFMTVIRGRKNVITLKEFRSQLLAEEATVENHAVSESFVTSMVAQDTSVKGKALILGEGSLSGLSKPQTYGGSSSQGGYNNHSSTYIGGHTSNSFRRRGRGRNNNFQTTSRYNARSPNSGAGILGHAKPHISTCPRAWL